MWGLVAALLRYCALGSTLVLGDFHSHLLYLRGPAAAHAVLVLLLDDPIHEWREVFHGLVLSVDTHVLTLSTSGSTFFCMASKSRYLQVRVTPEQKGRLKRLADAAGQDVSSYVLGRALPSSGKRFDELVALLAEGDNQRYVLAELNDLLARLAGNELADAVAAGDVSALGSFHGNYVAAMVEQACASKGVQPPPWTGGVEPLTTPHFAAPLKSVRLHLLKRAPVAFKRRNLFVDASVGDRV